MAVTVNAALFQTAPAVFNSPNISAKLRKAILCTVKAFTAGYSGSTGHKASVVTSRNLIAPMPEPQRRAAEVNLWLTIINDHLGAGLTTNLNGASGLIGLSQDYNSLDEQTLDVVDLFLTATLLNLKLNG